MYGHRQRRLQSEDGRGAILYVPIVLSTILLQKVALPQTENMLSLGSLFPPLLVGFGLATRRLAFAGPILLLASFFAVLSIDIIFGSTLKINSLSSLALILVTQAPLATRPIYPAYSYRSAMRFYSTLVLCISVLGVAQYFSQWFLPTWASFPLDYLLPDSIRLVGYNNLNPLAYGAERIKSNGVFFAEPSFFSQSVALAAIIELRLEQRIVRLLIFAAGLLVSYSGTGLLIFAPVAALHVLQQRRYKLFLAASAAVLGVLSISQFLQIGTMTQRISEFGTTDTSGNARFISIFDLIVRFQIEDPSLLFFGTGAGQINSFIKLLPFDGFGPTWGKVIFEFGVCGFISYMAFLAALYRERVSVVSVSLLIIYLFGGGYLSDEAILAPFLLFVSWAPSLDKGFAPNENRQAEPGWSLRRIAAANIAEPVR